MDINKLVEDIFDDGAKGLDDTRFNYFIKYCDSQLDEIYEQDMRAREIIDKIRKNRCLSRQI